MISSFLMVGLGGAIGAMLRYGAGLLLVSAGIGPNWLATFSVNVIGSFAMGVMASLMLALPQLSEQVRLFIMVGLLGALTTFSSFALDSYHLFTKEAWLSLAFYVVGSVLFSFIFFALGLWLMALLRASGGAG